MIERYGKVHFEGFFEALLFTSIGISWWLVWLFEPTAVWMNRSWKHLHNWITCTQLHREHVWNIMHWDSVLTVYAVSFTDLYPCSAVTHCQCTCWFMSEWFGNAYHVVNECSICVSVTLYSDVYNEVVYTLPVFILLYEMSKIFFLNYYYYYYILFFLFYFFFQLTNTFI